MKWYNPNMHKTQKCYLIRIKVPTVATYSTYMKHADKKIVKNTVEQVKVLPEYILSSTRGTAQKIVGFSSPMSSSNNLTSC